MLGGGVYKIAEGSYEHVAKGFEVLEFVSKILHIRVFIFLNHLHSQSYKKYFNRYSLCMLCILL